MQASALGTTIRSLAVGPLPGPADIEVGVPPVRTAWSRRVAGMNLWIYYSWDDARVFVLTVVTSPPVPIV